MKRGGEENGKEEISVGNGLENRMQWRANATHLSFLRLRFSSAPCDTSSLLYCQVNNLSPPGGRPGQSARRR